MAGRGVSGSAGRAHRLLWLARMNKLAALLLAGSAAACATNGQTPSEEGAPQQHLPKTSSPSFTLYVSNQSLDKQLVDIQVFIDGQLAVSGDFSVFQAHDEEGCGGAPLPQHNWYEFGFNLTPGPHSITVLSADSTTTLETSNNGMRWGVLDFWYDATTDEPEHFNFTPTANQPYFE